MTVAARLGVAARFAAVVVLAAPVWAQQAGVTCPSIIKVTDASGRTVEHKYERISVFNGRSGGAEYDLAPDDEKKTGSRMTQMWFLSEYRSMPLFVRCRYTGTVSVVDLDLAAALKTCTQQFNIDRNGKISGPFEMVCR